MVISRLKPLLDRHNVSLVGVGLEELGATEFVELGFFKGGMHCCTCLQVGIVHRLSCVFFRIVRGRKEAVLSGAGFSEIQRNHSVQSAHVRHNKEITG